MLQAMVSHGNFSSKWSEKWKTFPKISNIQKNKKKQNENKESAIPQLCSSVYVASFQ